MCLGRTHVCAGAATGLAAAEYALHLPLATTLTFTALTAAAAVLPDLDHQNASLAHCFGFATKLFARLVGAVSGGHRHGTHSVLGTGVFTGLAWLAVHYRQDVAGRAGLCVLLALLAAGGLYALGAKGHLADLAAIGGAVAMTWTGYGLSLVAVATGLGCAAHVATDMLTDKGCPLLWPVSGYHWKFWPEPLAFSTGTKPETVFAAATVLAAAALAWHAATMPGFIPAH